MNFLAVVAIIVLIAMIAAAVWMVRADREKSSYQRDLRLVSLVIAFLSLLLFIAIIQYIL